MSKKWDMFIHEGRKQHDLVCDREGFPQTKCPCLSDMDLIIYNQHNGYVLITKFVLLNDKNIISTHPNTKI